MKHSIKSLAMLAAVALTAAPAFAAEGETQEKTPAIVLQFAEGTQAVRLGTGCNEDFSIDWGDGVEVEYNGQAYYSELLKGNTVKIYGNVILLYANNQDVVAADFTNAADLQRIQLNQNSGLTELKLGNHPVLDGIYAQQCALKSIDVSGCPAIKVLDLIYNEIEGTIDCSAMTRLSKVDIYSNKVTSLVLPKVSTVFEIDCSYNNISSIDITNLPGLTEFSAQGNKLTTVDFTGLTGVEELYLGENKIATLDLSPCSALETISAFDNEIASIDLSANEQLEGVYFQDNRLTSLDLSANGGVRYLNLEGNDVSSIDVSNLPNLSICVLADNELASIDLSKNSRLSSLDLRGNKLTSIDVKAASYLSQFHIEDNALESIDLSSNGYLYGFFAGNNKLTSLDLTHNPYVQRLEVYGNKLASLDITENGGLQSIYVQNNLFDDAAMASFIEALPDVTNVSVNENNADFARQLNISDMPGTASADVAAAEAKGWTVTAVDSGVDGIVIDSDRTVASEAYYNLNGVRVTNPANGVAVRVVTYTDGTRKAEKIVVK